METYPYLNMIEPDVEDLITVIQGKKKAKRLHVAEIFLDQEIKDALWTAFLDDTSISKSNPDYPYHREIILHRAFGYDIFRVPVIRKTAFHIKDTKAVSGSNTDTGDIRTPVTINWIEEHKGPIQTWENLKARGMICLMLPREPRQGGRKNT